MDNMGKRWLESLQMSDASDIKKICALSALELCRITNVCEDAYSIIWEGNVDESQDMVCMLRRCIIRGFASIQDLLLAINVTPQTVYLFCEEEENRNG